MAGRSKQPQIPIIVGLSRLDDRKQILYSCPKCKESLEMLGNMTHECPKCGISLEWGSMPMRVSTEFREQYESVLYAEEKQKKKPESSKGSKKKQKLETKEDILFHMVREYVAQNI